MKKGSVIFLLSVFFLLLISSFNNKGVRNAAALGELLFSDPILSKDRSISCTSCHIPGFAFADTAALSTGVFGRKGKRNSPSAMNVLLRKNLFWDGRVNTLEEQALAPIENPDEMDLPLDSAISRLKQSKFYDDLFREVYNTAPSVQNLAAAISAFERTLETSDSPFDNWKFSGDSNAVSASVKRGFELFNTKGKCIQCHFGADFTANEFRNVGLFNAVDLNDSGRAVVTKNPADIGKFKTPALRNVALTAPYMHNGMFKTLGDVIDFYNDTRSVVGNSVNKDSILLTPLGLNVEEKKDLKAFLESLTDKRFYR